MKTQFTSYLGLAALVLFLAGPVLAADQDRDQIYNDNSVYGWQLMNEQERNEYRERMLELRTEQERNEYRYEHHELMEERAESRGIELKDDPMQRGYGMEAPDGMRPGSSGMGGGSMGGGGMGGGR